MKRTGCVQPLGGSQRSCQIAPGLTSDLHVLHGSQICNVQLTDLTSGNSLYTAGIDAPDVLSSLGWASSSVFLACACSGGLYVGDTRSPSAPQPAPAGGREAAHWCMAVSRGVSSEPSGCRVARLSSSGQVVLSDMRELSRPVGQGQRRVQGDSPSHNFMSVSWAPALDRCLSVSGLNGLVEIYDTSLWRPESGEAQPLFVHQGHVTSCAPRSDISPPVVTSHAWHPRRPRTMLSAASDGSVQVWDWVH